MKKQKSPYTITRGKVIFDFSAVYCDTPEMLLKSELFGRIVELYLERIASRGSSSFAYLMETLPPIDRAEIPGYLVNLFRLLASHTRKEVIAMNMEYEEVLASKGQMHEMVEELYNFWRGFERFLYIESPRRPGHAGSGMHHSQFIKTNEGFTNLVLSVYRTVSENVLGMNPRVYRQLPAGANIGILAEKTAWEAPPPYEALGDIPFIRLSLIEPPLILYPAMNKRKGRFEEVDGVTARMLELDPDEWFCYPAKVGELTAFIFFHQDFISMGLSLSNLFVMAEEEDIEGRKPDIMLVFGLKSEELPGDTLFFEDKKNDMLVGLVRHTEEVDYFGYFKKMTLTLHNIVMLNRGRLPVHGAMVFIKLKDGVTANIAIIGDSGAGKSETLEALRSLAEEHICEMRIIYDDMGSLGISEDGRVLGYGTEIGAFVRLDDLQPGYAYEEIDRSIFMNPDKVNARLVIPITRYSHIVKGYTVDILLYANNYDQVDEDHAAIDFFGGMDEALQVFRSGARLAKGTTDEKGLVHTYFANPFGAPQRKDVHEKIAAGVFEALFGSGARVGQIRTRLGIEGYEQEGPKAASIELFKVLRKHYPAA